MALFNLLFSIHREPEVKIEPEDDDNPDVGNHSADGYLSSDPETDLDKEAHKMPPPIPMSDAFERYPRIEPQRTDALQNLNFVSKSAFTRSYRCFAMY